MLLFVCLPCDRVQYDRLQSRPHTYMYMYIVYIYPQKEDTKQETCTCMHASTFSKSSPPLSMPILHSREISGLALWLQTARRWQYIATARRRMGNAMQCQTQWIRKCRTHKPEKQTAYWERKIRAVPKELKLREVQYRDENTDQWSGCLHRRVAMTEKSEHRIFERVPRLQNLADTNERTNERTNELFFGAI